MSTQIKTLDQLSTTVAELGLAQPHLVFLINLNDDDFTFMKFQIQIVYINVEVIEEFLFGVQRFTAPYCTVACW